MELDMQIARQREQSIQVPYVESVPGIFKKNEEDGVPE